MLWVGVVAALLLSCRPLAWAAATPAWTEIRGEERIQLLETLRARQRKVQAVRATVSQRKRHPLLKEEAVSEGTLLFQRPDRLRWEVTKPERIIILIDRQRLLTYRPERKEAERRDLRQDFASRAAVELLTAAMDLALDDLEKRFRVDLFREQDRTLLMLIPRSRLVAEALASIAICLHDGDAVPRGITVVGQQGDRTETSLSHVTINPPVFEDAFLLQMGPAVRVTDVPGPAGEEGGGR
jgi:outer membrane lipoprotein-sorting protein